MNSVGVARGRETRKVRLKEDQPRFNLKAGDELIVRPYWLDPDTKFTVEARVSDGYDPCCNVYRDEVEACP